jgi:hypothetical protein
LTKRGSLDFTAIAWLLIVYDGRLLNAPNFLFLIALSAREEFTPLDGRTFDFFCRSGRHPLRPLPAPYRNGFRLPQTAEWRRLTVHTAAIRRHAKQQDKQHEASAATISQGEPP